MKKFRCAKFLWQRLLSSTLAVALAVTSWPSPTTWAQSSPRSVSTSTPSIDLTHLDLSTLAVPEMLGSVQERWQPSGGQPKGLVIHIQDLHTHPEAQRHLSELIGYLHDTLGVNLVALEGAEGFCDTSFFSAFPEPKIVQRISHLFVDEGLFAGSEEYAITHPGQVTLWGVEDAPIYLEHLRTYQQGAGQQAPAQQTLKALRKALHAQIHTPIRHHCVTS